jgi:hypothetical protein
MNTKLIELQAFLDNAHKKGTDCQKAEEKLIEAKELLPYVNTPQERKTLETIISELEQVHQVCSLPLKRFDDDWVAI